MIIGVSIVDLHKPKGQRFVGSYLFEIDYPMAEHKGQMEFFTTDCVEQINEALLRPHLNKLMTKEEIPNPVDVHDGTKA